MAKIARGKTEGEHRAQEQAQTVGKEFSAASRGKRRKKLSQTEVEQVKEAMQELEETKGDLSKDH